MECGGREQKSDPNPAFTATCLVISPASSSVRAIQAEVFDVGRWRRADLRREALMPAATDQPENGFFR